MQMFGDGFDLYAAPADAINGYWDSGSVGFTLVAGRFANSRAIQASGSLTGWLIKNSGQNDVVHHIVCSFQTQTTISGATLSCYFLLGDGATNQCCIVFRSDGAVVLTSGGPAGTVLATYTGAFTATNTWYAYEFEVVISATVGAFRVRKNGNTSNDFDSGATLNTRPGTNNYANRLQVGQNSAGTQLLDDLLWRSDASSVPWVGDIRCFTRMPASDASVAWSRSGSVVPLTPIPQASTVGVTANGTKYTPFTVPCNGTIGTVSAPITVASTANIKCSIFASSGSAPTTVLGSATPVSAPGIGTATWTFGTPVSVTQGTQYWVGTDADTSSGTFGACNTGLGALTGGTAYASFPVANPTGLSAGQAPAYTINITPTGATNAPFVADIQQDGANSYVYSSTVSQSDLYGISAIGSTPSSIVGVTTRGYLQKSDAGTRNVAVQLQSGATNVQSASTALNTVFNWIYRTDLVDPATGAAWTAVGVSNAQVGAVVTA